MMQQSNVIAACLFIAFVVFITVRGKLPQYLAALFGTNQAPASASGGGGDGASGSTAAPVDSTGQFVGSIRRSLGVENGVLPNLLPGLFGSGQ